MLLVASQITNLLNSYELTDIIIIIICAFFIYKEIKKYVAESKKEKKDENEAYYDNRYKEEAHDQDIEKRICKLESNMRKDYDRIRQSESHLFQLESQVEKIGIFVRDLRIESMRNTILDAVPDCIDLNKMVSAERYRNLFKLYSSYEAILQENDLSNSEISLAIAMIKTSWNQRETGGKFTENFYLSPEKANERIKQASDSIPGFWELEEYEKMIQDDKNKSDVSLVLNSLSNQETIKEAKV